MFITPIINGIPVQLVDTSSSPAISGATGHLFCDSSVDGQMSTCIVTKVDSPTAWVEIEQTFCGKDRLSPNIFIVSVFHLLQNDRTLFMVQFVYSQGCGC